MPPCETLYYIAANFGAILEWDSLRIFSHSYCDIRYSTAKLHVPLPLFNCGKMTGIGKVQPSYSRNMQERRDSFISTSSSRPLANNGSTLILWRSSVMFQSYSDPVTKNSNGPILLYVSLQIIFTLSTLHAV